MAIALTDVQIQRYSPPIDDGKIKTISVLVAHQCPLFRVGLRSFLVQQSDCSLIGEATHLEDVLALAREQRPDIVLLDGGLTSTDPLDLVQQLRQVGVRGIFIFAPPAGDEETLFRYLMCGAMAYEDPFLSGEELLAKIHRVALGECLITGDILAAQAARREHQARILRRAQRLLAESHTEHCQPPVRRGASRTSENPFPLSERELATLEHIARGLTNAQAAQALGISPHTVKHRLDTLYQTLAVHDRTSAVVMALRNRWMTLDGIHSVSL
jgi:DNA-binding NarL/FixJ family response regulator